jgi:hypothetical protein
LFGISNFDLDFLLAHCLDDPARLIYRLVMKILRRSLFILALACIGSICTGCDDEDEGTLGLRAWMPVQEVIVSTSTGAGGSATP